MEHLVTGRWGGLGASWRSGVAPRAQAVWRGHRSGGRLGRGRHGPGLGAAPSLPFPERAERRSPCAVSRRGRNGPSEVAVPWRQPRGPQPASCVQPRLETSAFPYLKSISVALVTAMRLCGTQQETPLGLSGKRGNLKTSGRMARNTRVHVSKLRLPGCVVWDGTQNPFEPQFEPSRVKSKR